MTKPTRPPTHPGITTRQNSPRPSTARRLVLRCMLAISILAGSFALTTKPAAASANPCHDGDDEMCFSWEVCLFFFCISGKEYYTWE